MGKKILIETKDPAKREPIKSKIHKVLQKPANQKSNEKHVQFFEFLKDLQRLEGRNNSVQTAYGPLLNQVSESVMRFFNQSKNQSRQELERYVIYLANLLNILGDKLENLCLEGKFKTKMRKFLKCTMQEKSESNSKNSKVHAILYILAVLVYNEKINKVHSTRIINSSLYSDRALVKLLLSLTLSKYKRMSKYYGVIIMHLANQQNSQKTKQAILKSIILNISKINHENTFFNLLIYLRSEKNKVRINYQDILEGEIFEILIESYPRQAHKRESFIIIDYINHLLSLFPSLASKIPQNNYISDLLLSATPLHAQNPLQESSIISFVHLTLKYVDSSAKNSILSQIVNFMLSNRQMALKLAHIVLDYEIDKMKMMQLVEKGYFESLLDLISPESDENVVRQSIEVYRKICLKCAKINTAVSEYLDYQLNCRLRIIQERNIHRSGY